MRKRYIGEGFSYDYLATLGSDFSVKKFGRNDELVIQIWDLAGQPKFSLVRQAYYLGTRGVILVYDITRPDTFYSIPNWINEAVKHRNSDIPLALALVANKIDLRDDNLDITVSTSHGQDYANELSNWSKMKVPYIETSAKTGFNVDEMFSSLIENMTAVNKIIKGSA